MSELTSDSKLAHLTPSKVISTRNKMQVLTIIHWRSEKESCVIEFFWVQCHTSERSILTKGFFLISCLLENLILMSQTWDICLFSRNVQNPTSFPDCSLWHIQSRWLPGFVRGEIHACCMSAMPWGMTDSYYTQIWQSGGVWCNTLVEPMSERTLSLS